MDRFIGKIKEETHGEVVGDLEIVRIPLDLYRARNATSRALAWFRHDHPWPIRGLPALRLGDGLADFQAISLGFESAFFLAGHIANRELSLETMFDRYETFMYQQWLRVYMRSRMIKHNKTCSDRSTTPWACSSGCTST